MRSATAEEPGPQGPSAQQGPAVQPPRHAPPQAQVASGSVVSRIAWFFLFAIPLAVVITATQLTPSGLGFGTHTQLGLPPCGFMAATGLPCPGCGLTTCFSHMVRFEFVEEARANPFGVPLFLVTFFTIQVAAMGFLRGTNVIDTLERFHFEKIAIMLALCSISVWFIKVGITLF